MPSDERVRPDDHQRVSPIKKARQRDHDEPGRYREQLGILRTYKSSSTGQEDAGVIIAEDKHGDS
jgi:hypothetical protein